MLNRLNITDYKNNVKTLTKKVEVARWKR